MDWKDYLKSRNMDYNGNIVLRAQSVTWAQLEPALPSKEKCGAIRSVEIAEGEVLEYLLNPEKALKPNLHLKACPKAGKNPCEE